jgi:hypothetical protein
VALCLAVLVLFAAGCGGGGDAKEPAISGTSASNPNAGESQNTAAIYTDCPAFYQAMPVASQQAAVDAIAAGRYYKPQSGRLCAVEAVVARANGDDCHFLAFAPDYAACDSSHQPSNPYIFRSLSDWGEKHIPPPLWPNPPFYGSAPYLAKSLSDARSMRKRGLEPILPITGIFDEYSKELLPDFQARINRLVNENADLFAEQGVKIEIVDEIYMDGLGGNITAKARARQSASAIAATNAVRAAVPNALVGMVISPEVWLLDPAVLDEAAQLATWMDWVGIDPYLFKLSQTEVDVKIHATNEFADRMAQHAPGAKRYLFIQGFAFSYGGYAPSEWSESQAKIFTGYIAALIGLAEEKFNISSVWGWGYSVDGTTAGMNFPPGISAFYKSSGKPTTAAVVK